MHFQRVPAKSERKNSKCLIFANFPVLNHSVIMLVTQSEEKNYKGEICIIPGIFCFDTSVRQQQHITCLFEGLFTLVEQWNYIIS